MSIDEIWPSLVCIGLTSESLPQFISQAARLWGKIAIEHKSLLLANVWCRHCSHSVIIKNFTGVVKSGDLSLVGKCAWCHGDVARLIDSAGLEPEPVSLT